MRKGIYVAVELPPRLGADDTIKKLLNACEYARCALQNCHFFNSLIPNLNNGDEGNERVVW